KRLQPRGREYRRSTQGRSSWPVLLVVLLIGLAVLYRYGPDRRAARWQWVSVGSVFAAVTWIVASFLFSWYLTSFGKRYHPGPDFFTCSKVHWPTNRKAVRCI